MPKATSGLRTSDYTEKSVLDSDGSFIDLTETPLRYSDRDTSLADAVQKSIDDFEAARRDSKVEFGRLVDANGNVIQDARGGKSSVKTLTRNWVNAEAYSHIHPREPGTLGGSFSDADLIPFVNHGVKQMRAAAKEGTYVISKGANFDGQGLQQYYKDTGMRLRSEMKQRTDDLEMMLSSGQIKWSEYSKQFDAAFNKYLIGRHNALLDGQKKYGYKYGLERRK